MSRIKPSRAHWRNSRKPCGYQGHEDGDRVGETLYVRTQMQQRKTCGRIQRLCFALAFLQADQFDAFNLCQGQQHLKV